MLQIVLPWISPPSAAIEAAVWSADHGSKGSADATLLSACKALLAAAAVQRIRAQRSLSGTGSYMPFGMWLSL